MAKIIKLENLVSANYDRETGKELLRETVEYVCKSCRHLVSPSDKVCWQCGRKLTPSSLVEHYYKGKQLTEDEFSKRKELGR